MNRPYILLIFFMILAACSSLPPQPTSTSTPMPSPMPTATILSLPPIFYIGGELPGADPQRFGESFFSGTFHSSPTFSPDGNTVWWAGEFSSATIYTSQFQSNTWTEPEIISFSESISSYRDPFISPDGNRFYFISTLAIPGISPTSKENLWMMERQGEGWSEPQPLPPSINDLSLHWTVSVANNYDLFFSAQEDGNAEIFQSRYINGAYTDPIQLEDPVNTESIEITPNIAPDGSYMLFTRIASNRDQPYLYITFAVETGWSDPVRVDNIPYCISPIITPDRSFVIFMSSPGSFAWRDTTFIEDLRPEN